MVEFIQYLLGLVHISPELGASVFLALFAVSEALAYIPFLKSNSVFQMIVGVLKKLAGK